MHVPAPVATFRRLATLAAAVALLGLLAVRPSIDRGAAVRAAGRLPACRYDDILTSPRGYDDWSITLVDTILRLPASYAPPDLVSVSSLGVPGSGQVRAVIAADLQAMSAAATAAGAPIGVTSAYRSFANQKAVFAKWVSIYGRTQALRISARPGHSEHQLGLTIDFRSDPPVATLNASWGTTPAGKWMRNHAWEFGFVMSYPKGKSSLTCYDYEPWHFRYVGRDLAALVHSSGLTLREYLWANFTTTVVPPPPPSTPKPVVHATARPTEAAPTIEPPPSLPRSVPPTLSPETAPPQSAAIEPTKTETPPPAAPAPPLSPVSGSLNGSLAPALLGIAGIALGTIVLGSLLFRRRRGRSGVGL